MFPCSLRYFANVPLFPKTPGRPSYIETDILKLSKSNTYSVTNSVLLLKSPGGISFNWLLFKVLPRNKPFRLFSINIYTKVNYDWRQTKCTKAGHEKS